jgi:hypothetical protein
MYAPQIYKSSFSRGRIIRNNRHREVGFPLQQLMIRNIVMEPERTDEQSSEG